MKYADELRGSEGERCKVTDLRTGTIRDGVIEAWDDDAKRATVRYGNGQSVSVGYSFVSLLDEEKP